MIDHIENSLKNAELGSSKLTDAQLNISGFTSQRIRHFLNNICNLPKINYLEVGVHKGATFVSSCYGNDINSAVAVDNWVDFENNGESEATFRYVSDHYCKNVKICKKSFKELTLGDVPNKINVYLYDGPHDYQDQVDALVKTQELMADEFIYMVDDFSWENVYLGAMKGIEQCDYEVKYYISQLGDVWWNGFGIFYLGKKK